VSQEKDCLTFAPLDLFCGEENLLLPQAQRRWLLALMILGLVLRLTRYLLRFPLWEDEAMLSANLLDRGYGQLLQPLKYCQIAPTLFLWGQLMLVKLLGFNEYTLRLIPFLCGLGSLLLFRHVAGRLLQGTSLVLAVGLFAVAYPMTRYAAEAKPYGCDLLVGLAMLTLTIEWLRRPDQTRWLWYLAALVGPAVGYSFPAIFMAGGVSLVILGKKLARTGHSSTTEVPPAARGEMADGTRRVPATLGWFPWIVFNVLLIASVGTVLLVSKYSVGGATQQTMEEDWGNAFPPVAKPVELPLWFLETHAGAMLAYPVGGPNWGSTFSMLSVAGGLAVLMRRRQWLLLSLLLAPLGLNFIAAALHRFPYGGHARMTLFLAPAFCMLIAIGLTAALAWIECRRRIPSTSTTPSGELKPTLHRAGLSPPRTLNGCTIALGLLVLLGAGSWFRDVTQPYKSATTLRAREFAQWFWFELSLDSELVSCETDLKTDLSPEKLHRGWSSLYFCNQRIYSPRHARGEKPRLDRVSVDRPLRCVLYRSPREEQESPPADPQARQRWLEKMQADFDWVAHDAYPFAAYDKSDRQKKSDDYVEVFKFVPKGGRGAAAKPWQMQ